MNEAQITQKIIRTLNEIPECYARKQFGGRFSAGDPDIRAVYYGHAVLIETKLDGGILSELQAIQMDRWNAAGAIVLLAVYDKSTKTLGILCQRPGLDSPYYNLPAIRIKSKNMPFSLDFKAASWESFLKNEASRKNQNIA